MKIFILTHCIPYPLNAGGNISQFAILEKLQFQVDITLCFKIRTNEEWIAYEGLKAKLVNVNIVPFDERVKPLQISRLNRIKKLIKKVLNFIFTSNKDKTTNLSFASQDDFDLNYRITPCEPKSYGFCAFLSTIFNAYEFDIYQIEFYELVDLVNLLPSNKATVFVHHEIRYQRLYTAIKTSLKNNDYKNYIIQIVKDFELRQLSKFSNIITFSKNDFDILLRDISNDKLTTIPFPVRDIAFDDFSVTSITKIVFVGGEEHWPNAEGIKWFLDYCFENIFEKTKLPLHIIGKWSEVFIKQYASDNKIIFPGFVDDLVVFSKDAISISPIRIGSGIRTKILYAMACKSPIVTTTIGVEGIDIKHNQHLMIADTPDDFVNSVVVVFTNLSTANKLANSAYQYVFENFRQDVIIEMRIDLYRKLIKQYT